MVQQTYMQEDIHLSGADDAVAAKQPSGRVWLRTLGAALFSGTVTAFVLGLPDHSYVASTELRVDGARAGQINEALVRLRSNTSLDNLARMLNLSTSREFAEQRSGVSELLADLASGQSASVAEREATVRRRLLDAMTITAHGNQVTVRVAADDAGEARAIADTLSRMVGQELSNGMRATVNPALAGARDALERADAAVSGYKAQVGVEKLAVWQRVRGEWRQVSGEMADADAAIKELDAKVTQAATMTVADVISKQLPDSLEYTGLEYDRERYMRAKLDFERIATDLGPRHPRYLAGQSAVDSIRAEIDKGLKQLVLSLRQQQADAANRLATLKKRSQTLSADKEALEGANRLAGLETAANEAQENYLQMQQHDGAAATAPRAIARIAKPLWIEETGRTWLEFSFIVSAGLLGGAAVGSLSLSARRPEDEQAQAETNEALLERYREPDADEMLAISDLDLLQDARTVETLSAVDDDIHDTNWAVEDMSPEHGLFEDEFDADAHDRYIADNDVPLAVRIREILSANSLSRGEADMPPLLTALMEGRADIDASLAGRTGSEEDELAELLRLRDEMIALRERMAGGEEEYRRRA